MPIKAEEIDHKESKRLAKLRQDGPKKLEQCLQSQINDMPILDQVATLADTGQLSLFYEAVGQARTEDYSWRTITDAATGKSDYDSSRNFSLNYKSFCKNNGIEPVKIRGNKSET